MEQIILSPIPLNELKMAIREITEEALLNIQNRPQKAKSQIVDGDYLQKKFGVTRQTLGRWRKQNKIPFIKQGGIIRYDLDKVIESLEKKKR
ncbi:helix-turn-helix domain-containing protein [Cecembia rubra]|uniref:Helix-turn-helix protein n=1 Tax=Cecembia rubra TaxID=1485585 RepID=A0A2P8E348_9BACT|nr:helix-turn-helix domain-containing protein [Cecembia rubra]PSL03876.1 hypothetical protein CLV48_106116 [Cecembia rubra]